MVVMRSTSPVLRALLNDETITDLDRTARTIATWSPGSHRWGHYAEMTATGPAICRTENVSACSPGVASLVDGVLRDTATAQLGARTVAFKDKINYKQPGGAGFHAHQDQTAYPGAPDVVSILVALDPCTRSSGCLWVAPGISSELPIDERGVIRDDVATSLSWEAVELDAGDALVIDGFLPHRSDPNTTDQPRRVLIASYAEEALGYTRSQYYAARSARMVAATAADGRFRISTHADFAGTEVAPIGRATDRCTHD